MVKVASTVIFAAVVGTPVLSATINPEILATRDLNDIDARGLFGLGFKAVKGIAGAFSHGSQQQRDLDNLYERDFDNEVFQRELRELLEGRDIDARGLFGIGLKAIKGIGKVFHHSSGNSQQQQRRDLDDEVFERELDELLERHISDFEARGLFGLGLKAIKGVSKVFTGGQQQQQKRNLELDEMMERNFDDVTLEARKVGSLLRSAGRFLSKHRDGVGAVAQGAPNQYQQQQQQRNLDDLYEREIEERELESLEELD
ncbi:hypothetical protein BDQ17DRAFT_1322889 [Cyathus striatus]|nr:hypothetical protein BDQ17DRAFT_1322889 [Cyathus striatus]